MTTTALLLFICATAVAFLFAFFVALCREQRGRKACSAVGIVFAHRALDDLQCEQGFAAQANSSARTHTDVA